MLLNPTVLITGASAGIGRATTLVLAQANANVIATARSNEALLELSKKCAEMGQPIRTLAGDLNDHDFIRALTLFAGEVDILINNAGVLTYAPILETQPDDYLAMFNTNVFATLALTQAIARGMLARGRGHLIMVTSTGAREVFLLRARTARANMPYQPLREACVSNYSQKEFAFLKSLRA